MKVSQDSWCGPAETELASALTVTSSSNEGISEQARDLAKKNAEITGKLVAALVEKGIFDFDTAADICGVCKIRKIY